MNCWNVNPQKTSFPGSLICWTSLEAVIFVTYPSTLRDDVFFLQSFYLIYHWHLLASAYVDDYSCPNYLRFTFFERKHSWPEIPNTASSWWIFDWAIPKIHPQTTSMPFRLSLRVLLCGGSFVPLNDAELPLNAGHLWWA